MISKALLLTEGSQTHPKPFFGQEGGVALLTDVFPMMEKL